MKARLNTLCFMLAIACFGCAGKVPTVAQNNGQHYDKALSERMMPPIPLAASAVPLLPRVQNEGTLPKENGQAMKEAAVPTAQSGYDRSAAAKVWLDSLGSKNRRLKYAAGYRVLVYAGTNRELAMKAREALVRRHPDTQFYLTYKHPSFKLVGGDFMDRVEAQRLFRTLKPEYPNALIVDSEININE